MNKDNITYLINKGINITPSLLRDYSILTAILYAFVLIWFFISDVILVKIFSLLIQIVSVVTIITVFKLTSKPETIKTKLMLKLLFSLHIVINSTLFSSIVYMDFFKNTFHMIFIFLLPLSLFVLFYLYFEIKFICADFFKIKKKITETTKFYIVGGIGTLGITTSVLGRNFVKNFLKDVSFPAECFIIVFFSFLACIFTISIGNVVKLKYLKRIEKNS